MYLREFSIQGIKCSEAVRLQFPHEGDDYSGWIVLLGNNGMGKSTLIKAMGLSLMGPLTIQRLSFYPDGWVRQGRTSGKFQATFVLGEHEISSEPALKKSLTTKFAVTGRDRIEIEGLPYDQPQLIHLGSDRVRKGLLDSLYASKDSGWFSCGYGPYRRLGSDYNAALAPPDDPLFRYITLIRDDFSIISYTVFLYRMYVSSIDPNNADSQRQGKILEVVRAVINGLLPGPGKITRIDTTGLYFRTVGGAEVPAVDLSDGYRSFFVTAVDILLHLVSAYPKDFFSLVTWEGDDSRIHAEGIVLIDEVDAHLHPSWQREIGILLRRVFPRIQFIVASHSPFIAQAASDGGLIVLKPSGSDQPVQADRPVDSVRGWRVDQILTSPLFGLDATRDQETELLIRGHADLVARRAHNGLDRADKQRLAKIEKQLAIRLTAPGETVDERARQAEMAEFVAETLKKFEAKK